MTLSAIFSRRSFAYSLCFVAFTIPLTVKLNSVAIVIAAVFSLGYFIFNREEWKTKKIDHTPILLFGGLYLGVIVGFLNSSNISPALFDLEQKLSWIVLPLVFFLGGRLSKEDGRRIILYFLSSLTLVSIVSMFTEGFQILSGGFVWKDWGYSVPIDRIYLGLYLCFSVITLYSLYLKQSTGAKKILLIVWIALLLVAMLNAFAKMSLLAFLVLLFLYGFHFLYKRNRRLLSVSAILLLITSTAALIQIKEISLIVNSVLTQKAIDANKINHLVSDSFNARILNWQCAIDLLSTGNNWFTGIGTGDTQLALDDCYVNKLKIITPWFLDARFNPHNEYFSLWLNYGLLFLILFLFQLSYFLSRFYKQQFILGVSFIVIAALSFLTESVLETQKGIVFYTFFCLLLPFASSADSTPD